MAENSIFFGSDVEKKVLEYLEDCKILDEKYQDLVKGKEAEGKYDERAMQHFIDAIVNYDIDAMAFAIMSTLVVMGVDKHDELTEEEIDQMAEYNIEIEDWRSKISEYEKEIKAELGI